MTKVVISECFGGFSLSAEGEALYRERAGSDEKYLRNVDRDDPALVAVVEELGTSASGRLAALRVIEIPDDVKWHIHEYDGYESLHEDHRTWQSDGVGQDC